MIKYLKNIQLLHLLSPVFIFKTSKKEHSLGVIVSDGVNAAALAVSLHQDTCQEVNTASSQVTADMSDSNEHLSEVDFLSSEHLLFGSFNASRLGLK